MRATPAAVLRFLAPALMLLAAALFLHARSHPEPQVARQPLADFPRQVEDWVGKDAGISQDVRDILGPGDFLSRIYFRPGSPYIDFFVGYFGSQRTGNSIHSPKNCLPSSGWSPTDAGYLQIQAANGSPVTVNRYIISKGLDKQFVLYWYQAHGRVVASEYWAKYFLVKDAIALNRTDGSIVRVITPITPGEGSAAAQQRAVAFAQDAMGKLDGYIPR